MLGRRRARDDDMRLSELDLVVNEPFGWPGPLRFTSDPAPLPSWLGWSVMAAVMAYGGVGAGRGGDLDWSAGLLITALVLGLLARRFAREGVWVDADGLTARELFSTRRVAWSDAADILSTGGGGRGRAHTWIEQADGNLLLLPHMTSKSSAVGDHGLRDDLQILACWWRTGQRRAAPH